MLQIFHDPINDNTAPEQYGHKVIAIVDDLSEAGLIEDSIKIFWKTADIDSWTSVLMYVTDEPDTCTGWIPATADSGMIQ